MKFLFVFQCWCYPKNDFEKLMNIKNLFFETKFALDCYLKVGHFVVCSTYLSIIMFGVNELPGFFTQSTNEWIFSFISRFYYDWLMRIKKLFCISHFTILWIYFWLILSVNSPKKHTSDVLWSIFSDSNKHTHRKNLCCWKYYQCKMEWN